MKQEKYTYDRKKRLRKREERYQLILNWIKKEPLDRKKIADRLNENDLGVYENSLIKDYLKQMMEKREIGSLNKTFPGKDYKWIFKQMTGEKWDLKKNLYYFYTPRSKNLYDELHNSIKGVRDKNKCKIIIEDLSNAFRFLEIMSIFQTERFFSDKSVKRILKKRGIKPTQENIEKEKKNTVGHIMNNSKEKRKININIKGLKVLNGQTYFFVGDKKINVKELSPFFEIPRSKMSNIMLWVACYRELNGKHAYPLLLSKMFELFVEIEKESQIKV